VKKSSSKTIFLLFLLSQYLIFTGVAQAQLITIKRTPYNLVSNTLLGTGIVISNVKFNGVASTPSSTTKYDNIGFFKGATNIGLDSGIIMTTGTILNNGDGPHGPNNASGSGIDNNLPGDPDLNSIISPTQTFNKAVLEFDFVPSYDTVKFRYVFGSEEYPEFVNSINDAFGFFIRGPGITGPFSGNSKNIALLPNSSTPITINSVNNGGGNAGPCTNCSYYVDNQTVPGTTIQYDAFTTVLTAISPVQCGQIYHIKMAIADAQDGVLDSGVFLEALSFSSPVVSITSAVALGGAGHTGAAGDTVLFEGCGTAALDFQRGGNIALADTVHFTLSGTAAMGADFLSIPDSVVFPAGQNHVTLVLQAIEDNTMEGYETVIFTPININPTACITSGSKPFKLYLSDVVPVNANASQDSSIICPNQNSTIDANPIGGIPGYSYSWDQGIGAGKRHTVAPPVTTTYRVTVTDTCGSHVATDSVTIFVNQYTPVVASAGSTEFIYCPFESTVLSAQASGGAGFYKYSWDNGAGNTQSVTVAPTNTTNYTVFATDTCGNTSSSVVTVNVVPYSSLKVSVVNDTLVCKYDTAIVAAKGIDGHGPYSYSWNEGLWNDSTFKVTSGINKKYIVTVTDNCGYEIKDTVGVYISVPQAKFGYNFETNFLAKFLDSSQQNIVNYLWNFGDNSTSTQSNPSHEFETATSHLVQLIVTNNIGCMDSVSETIFPPLSLYIPSAFTPNGDGKNDTFGAEGIGITRFKISIYNRWGELVFESEDVEKRWEAKGVTEGVYIFVISAVSLDNKPFKRTGTITVFR
jgi:gliding motility-associated-like protein